MKRYKPFSNPIVNPNAPWWSKTKKKLIVNQTSQERLLYHLLKIKCPKLRIMPQKTFRCKGRRYYLDMYIPRSKIAVEIDGGYHLSQLDKDAERDSTLLIERSIITLRFTNEEFDENPGKKVDDILYAVSYYAVKNPFIYKETGACLYATSRGFKSKE